MLIFARKFLPTVFTISHKVALHVQFLQMIKKLIQDLYLPHQRLLKQSFSQKNDSFSMFVISYQCLLTTYKPPEVLKVYLLTPQTLFDPSSRAEKEVTTTEAS